MSQPETKNDQEDVKKESSFFKKLLNTKDLEYADDENYQSLLRKNFYNYDQVRQKRQLNSLRITNTVLVVALIVIFALYLVNLNDSTGQLDKVVDSSMIYVFENVMYTDNDVKYTEVVSELNVMRTLMNYSGQPAKRQYAISELYYIAVQLPDTFVSHRTEVYDAFKNLVEDRLDVGYKLLEELLINIVNERK